MAHLSNHFNPFIAPSFAIKLAQFKKRMTVKEFIAKLLSHIVGIPA